MPDQRSDPVFELIKAMTKAEKRHFVLYSQRQQRGEEGPLYLSVFKLLDRQRQYDERQLLRNLPGLSKRRLANVKRHLYQQLLTSLQLVGGRHFTEVEIRDLVSRAQILFHKGLYVQAQQLLEQARTKAQIIHDDALILTIVELEKQIEARFLIEGRISNAVDLAQLVEEHSEMIARKGRLSNLSLRYQQLYEQIGYVRRPEDIGSLAGKFAHLTRALRIDELTFFEQVQYCQVHVWHYHLLLKFPLSYRWAKRWVLLFEEQPHLRAVDMDAYLLGYDQLLSALVNIGDRNQLRSRLDQLANYLRPPSGKSEKTNFSTHHQRQVFLSLTMGRISLHFLDGTFAEGVRWVPQLEAQLAEWSPQLDVNHWLWFQYKIGCLYFGHGDLDRSLDYLNRIIHHPTTLIRADVQCYARILHLIAHYELGHLELLDYLVRSVYRFVRKIEDRNPVLEAILNFLRKELYRDRATMIEAFKGLRQQLAEVSTDPYARRAFLYLDIRAWLDAKITGLPLAEIIRKRNEALRSIHPPMD